MILPTHKIAIIATLSKGLMEGYRACEEKQNIPPLSDNQMVNYAVNAAANLYEQNKAEIDNLGVYFFAIPKP